jgi:hypothetical protein
MSLPILYLRESHVGSIGRAHSEPLNGIQVGIAVHYALLDQGAHELGLLVLERLARAHVPQRQTCVCVFVCVCVCHTGTNKPEHT